MEYRGDISPLFDSGWSVKTQNWKIEFNRGKSLRMSSLSAFFLQRRADYKVLLVIPHICHFFTQAKFLKTKIYTKNA